MPGRARRFAGKSSTARRLGAGKTMRKGKSKSPADLPGLGPKSRDMLARVGIITVAQLRKLGAVAAYARTRRANRNASLNLLWGLESALSGIPWQDVARRHRTSLLLALDDYEKKA
jgi:DNA transformation protein